MSLSLRKRSARQLAQLGDEPVLKFCTHDFAGWLLLSEAMPIAPGGQGGRLIADSQVWVRRPVSRSTGAPGPPILVRAPAGVHHVAQDLWPALGQREGERNDVQLAFRAGAGPLPRSLFPVEVSQ